MPKDMSRDTKNDGRGSGVPAIVTIVCGVIALNIIAGFSPDLAVAIALGTICVAAISFIIGVLRRK